MLVNTQNIVRKFKEIITHIHMLNAVRYELEKL